MIREIKSRGKRVDNGELVYGFYARCEDDYYIYVSESVCLDKETNHWENVLTRYNVHPKSVGQFAGLKDKKGIEIYEGDVVKYSDEMIDQVIYEEIHDEQGFLGMGFTWYDKKVEVIGNIYANPELLVNNND